MAARSERSERPVAGTDEAAQAGQAGRRAAWKSSRGTPSHCCTSIATAFEAEGFGEDGGGVVEVGQSGGQRRDSELTGQRGGELQPGEGTVINVRKA
jgi:hypothetical protein